MVKELMEFKPSSGSSGYDANPMPYRGDSPATKGFLLPSFLPSFSFLFMSLLFSSLLFSS